MQIIPAKQTDTPSKDARVTQKAKLKIVTPNEVQHLEWLHQASKGSKTVYLGY